MANASGVPSLTQRLVEVNKSLGWVSKSGRNKEQGYNYVEAVRIFDDVRDALNKHGVLFSHSVTDQKITVMPREGKSTQYLTEVSGTYAFINADDKHDVQSGEWSGQAIDTSDKGTWKAITGALKYIFIANHLLPTGDDPEADEKGDSDTPERRPTAPTGAIRRETPTSVTTGITAPQQKMLRARLSDRGLTELGSQKWFNKKITGKFSTKDWTVDDFDKVIKTLESKDDETENLIAEAMAHAGEK